MLDNNLDQETSMAVLNMEQNAANMALGQAVEPEEKYGSHCITNVLY